MPDDLRTPVESVARPFHVMTKPIGPICNLDCKYCFYLEKEKLYAGERKWAMPDDVLENYIAHYIGSQPQDVISFAWQGGEPTLLGVEYFRKVIDLQKKHAVGKRIENALQTNGTLIDDEWCEFLAANKFLVGLSIDGPGELHDIYRIDKKQQPTFDRVVRGLELMKKHGVEFNTLTVVNRTNSQKPLEVYRFLKSIGSGFMQFIPLVERLPQTRLKVLGFDLAEPSMIDDPERPPVTDWSVRSVDYGQFLISIFNEWVRRDVGRVYVQQFDVALGNWSGLGSSLCVFAEKCGSAMAMEHNGDLYSCDHYVYPQYRLGNVLNQSLGSMATSEKQLAFGNYKSDSLPQYCKSCEVRFACHGECPKHRFIRTPDGEDGLNYLCAGYKRFFNHIDPYMKTMAELLRRQQPPAMIMQMIAGRDRMVAQSKAGANEPCPCGSGTKFKKCCGKP